MARKTNAERVARYAGLLKGVKKHWSPSAARILGGTTYTHAEIIGRLQSMLDAIEQTAAAYAAWRDRVVKQRALEKSLRAFVGVIEAMVRTEVGNSAPLLLAFGLQPAKKTGPRTTQAKVTMVQKARATRVVRKTMGKRQRQKVRGSG